MTEDDVRRIVREEIAKLQPMQPMQPIDYRGHSPRIACACGPWQCVRAGTTAGPCERMRYLRPWP